MAIGTIRDVAHHLGVDWIWDRGYRGQEIVVGVIDEGIRAEGRAAGTGLKIRNVIGGRLLNWGQAKAGSHGNMCATDVLGMAPEARLYDLCYEDLERSAASNVVACFNWALRQHERDGTPHILTNSYSLRQPRNGSSGAENPNRLMAQMLSEVLDRGILVTHSAGNCGEACADARRCGQDIGPGRSISGINGHPLTITVGAANLLDQYIGYSSQGPAALHPEKPDLCGISHFVGYNASDTGTSAACPVVAGVLALLKQANPRLSQTEAKQLLFETARDIGPPGWDPHTGKGVIQADSAFRLMMQSGR
jgi:subtilisin family serine protease